MIKKKYNIEEIKQLMPDYVIGRLGTDEKEIVEKAMGSSPELKTLFDEISGAIGFLNNVKVKEPEKQYWVNLLPKIHERIERQEEAGFSWSKVAAFWKIAVPVAAVILIAIIYFTVINRQSGPTITEDKKELKKTDSVKEGLNMDLLKKEIVKDSKETEKQENENKLQQHRKLELNKKQLAKVKEEPTEKKKAQENKEELASENLEELVRSTSRVFEPLSEESAFIGGAGGFDDETEDELNRLSDNEQETLIKELKNSNL